MASLDEVFAASAQRQFHAAELDEIGRELLANCRLRKQSGPAELDNMPPAPTVIDQTLWLPWLTGSGTYMLQDLFRADGSANITQGSGGG